MDKGELGCPGPTRGAEAATNTTGDLSDGAISVLNHCLSWSKFVDTHLYHSRQWFNLHLTCYYGMEPGEQIRHIFKLYIRT